MNAQVVEIKVKNPERWVKYLGMTFPVTKMVEGRISNIFYLDIPSEGERVWFSEEIKLID